MVNTEVTTRVAVDVASDVTAASHAKRTAWLRPNSITLSGRSRSEAGCGPVANLLARASSLLES